MAQQTINVGSAPNDGTGTPLRTAFQYTNSNFTELYTAVGPSGNNIVVPGSATITGALTVDKNTNGQNRLVLSNPNTGTGAYDSIDFTAGTASNQILSMGSGYTGSFPYLTGALLLRSGQANGIVINTGGSAAAIQFGINDTLGMTLNSTGLGLGASPASYGGTFRTLAVNATDAGILDLMSNSVSQFRIFGNGSENRLGGITNVPLTFHTNNSEKMRIDSSGNVGIGLTPSAGGSIFYKTLELGKAGCGLFAGTTSLSVGSELIYLSGNAVLAYNAGPEWKYGNDGVAAIYSIENGFHIWYNATSGTAGGVFTPTQAMTLDASGNLLVGTTSQPSGVTLSRATIKSTSADWSSVIWNSNATPYGFRIQYDTDSNATGNEFLYCLGAANLRASIRSNGGIANYQANDVSLSDSRMKSDIKPLGSYWNKIKSLEIVTFKYKDQTHNDDNIGLIAQQVESVAPEFVDVDGFGNTPEDGVPLKTIYTTDLYHAAIKALQEAMTRIEVLESKLA